MAKAASVNLRLEPELDQKLSAVATRLDRSRSWVIQQALKEFIELQLWQMSAIEEGLRDVESGRVTAHEDVVAWVESWGQPDELPMPECK
jgi:predicted transcriptional regulator